MRTTIHLLFCFIWLNGMAQSSKISESFTLKNGRKLYYEIYGQGDPLLLLHGYTLSSKSWIEFVNDYSAKYKVILVDLQGHGKSGSFDSDLSIKSVASEVDELIQHLNFSSLSAIGFSFGGDVLFQLASSHPGLVKSFISIGACGFWNAKDFPNWIDWLSFKNIENLKYMYEHQSDENQIKKILDQLPNYSTSLTDEGARKIVSEILVVLGDKDDGIPLEYLARLRRNIPKCNIWILPNTGHGAHYGKNKNDFIKTSLAFLNGDWVQKK